MNGYESSDTDEWEESLETWEYLFNEEWVHEPHLIPVIWYNPLQPQGSRSGDEEDQEAAIDPGPTIAQGESNHDEPQGTDEEEDLAPMLDSEENTGILQHRPKLEVPENLQVPPLVTPENEESYWINDPLTFEHESDSQQSILGMSPIGATYNVIVQDDSLSEASSTEDSYSHATSDSISSRATSSKVTSTEISPSQASSPETVTSELMPLSTNHLEKAPVDELFFNEKPVNWS